MQITTATPDDIDSILKLQTQIYRVEKMAPDSNQTLQNQLDEQSCDVLVAKDDGRIIATATIYYVNVAVRGRPYALLEGFIVDEKYRRIGVGTALFEKSIEVAREKNCYKMIFTSGTDREDAQKFYEKLGFEKWGLEFRKDL